MNRQLEYYYNFYLYLVSKMALKELGEAATITVSISWTLLCVRHLDRCLDIKAAHLMRQGLSF